MDPQEQVDKDQSTVNDGVEAQENPEETTALGDPVTGENEVEVQDTSTQDEVQPEENMVEPDRVGLEEKEGPKEEEEGPEEKVEEQEEKVEGPEGEEVPEEKVEGPDEKVEEDPEEKVEGQEEKVEGPEGEEGPEEKERPEEKQEGPEGKVAEGPEGEGPEEGSEKSARAILTEAEAATNEFRENLSEKPEVDEAATATETVAAANSEAVEVKDTKTDGDDPIEGRPAPPDEKGGDTSATERVKDEPKEIPIDSTENPMENQKKGTMKDFPASESPDPNINITVKVTLLPAEQVITVASVFGQTVGKLKEHFAAELKMQPSEINLFHDKCLLDDLVTFGILGVEANGTIQLELQSADPENIPLKPYKQISGLDHITDIVSVNIPEENGESRTVTVEIEKTNKHKPYLGGFRHKLHGTEFHNASAQTNPRPIPWPETMRFCRSTQTNEQRNRVIQTTQDTSTQMTKIGCYVSVTSDKLIVPGKYFTSEEKEKLILEKVIILQKYLRQYLAKQYVNRLKIKREKRREFERLQCLQRKQEKEKRIKLEFERRMHPRANEDFDTLYDALEKWRLEEIARINATLTGAERKAALYMLLNQETEHLAAIGRHKLEADTENRENNIQNFLNRTSAPKMIKSTYDNKPTAIETPFTVRAKELRDIYNSIIMKHLTQDERLDILLTLKHTVQEHDCKLTQEILKLIDREADLLIRGVSNENLEGLRKRIATLYLQYIKTPTFNPEAAKFIRVPPDPTKISGKIYFCTSCNNYLQSTQFPLNVNARNPGSCKQCKKKDNEGRYRTDYSSYRHMLKVLRMNEMEYNDNSTVAYILQESDIRYLVEKVWGSESIISNSNDLYDLIFIRWNSEIPWSPWNCLLVTIEEAEKHGKLIDIYKAYDQVFVNKIQQKHQQAKNYFSRLPGTAEIVRKHQTNLVVDCTEKKFFSKQTSCSTLLRK